MTRRIRRSIVIPMLAAALASGVMPEGWTLCVAPDGHLVVEVAPEPGVICCAGEEGRDAETCAPESCASCQDLTLGQIAMVSKHASHDAPPPAPAAGDALLPPIQPAAGPLVLSLVPPFPSPSGRIRSAVLRC